MKYNEGGHYSIENGSYIAPISGFYEFTIQITIAGAHFYLLVDGKPFTYHAQNWGILTGGRQVSSSITAKLNEGSVVQVESKTDILQGFGVLDDRPGLYSWFSGHLLFPA